MIGHVDSGPGVSRGKQPGTSTVVLCFSPPGALQPPSVLALWPHGRRPAGGVSLANPLPCVSASSGRTPPSLSRSHRPAWLGPSPRHFPKVSVAAARAAPCGDCESEDLEPALASPLTLTRWLFQ